MDEFVNSRPNNIEHKHWYELVVNSAIHPLIVSANFKSLYYDSIEQCHESWEYLMYSDQIERKNAGRLTDKTLQVYAYLDSTDGWWCNGGVDPRTFCDLQPGDQPKVKLWGCYKPDSPRPDAQKPGKFIKYEHPYKDELSIFLLEVPKAIAEFIYSKAGVNPSLSDRQSGFWYSVWKHNIPVTIVEGAKKAASILTQGDAAIGLPGVNAAYRSKDDQGNPIESQLRSEIAMFATNGREIRICFDHDSKSKTQVYRADAFLIKKKKSTYSIHRRQATNLDNPIMEFEASQYHINITQKPLDKFLPIERQEFLTVADTLKQGKELPSLDEDPRKIANTLSSLSPDGTHKILESFKSLEVLRILTSTLEAFNSHDLELGNYRITYTPNDENSGDIKLFKTEHNGTTRVAVHLELSRTDEQMKHQVYSMAITSLEIDKLRLLATKLQIPTINSAANAHATRDIPLPLHPALAEIWNLLESSARWTSGANQSNEGFRERFQKDPNAKLTLGEQSQLYFKFLIQTKEEIIINGKTDIILPPLSEITEDLKLLREQSINNFYSPKISQNAETQKPTQEKPRNPEPQLNNLEV
ncbi:DUF3854 domain-containing protein [Nostoc sp. FACHB-973]|nr:DUF3854 domain-containing protein [Nostoc sp. FACHB-973]